MDGVLIALAAVAVGLVARRFVPDEHRDRMQGVGVVLLAVGIAVVAVAVIVYALD